MQCVRDSRKNFGNIMRRKKTMQSRILDTFSSIRYGIVAKTLTFIPSHPSPLKTNHCHVCRQWISISSTSVTPSPLPPFLEEIQPPQQYTNQWPIVVVRGGCCGELLLLLLLLLLLCVVVAVVLFRTILDMVSDTRDDRLTMEPLRDDNLEPTSRS